MDYEDIQHKLCKITVLDHFGNYYENLEDGWDDLRAVFIGIVSGESTNYLDLLTLYFLNEKGEPDPDNKVSINHILKSTIIQIEVFEKGEKLIEHR